MKCRAILILFFLCSGIASAQPRIDFRRKGAPIPPFAVAQLNGKTVTNAALQKGKGTIIAIFSPQCEHCADALDTLRMMEPLLRNKQIVLVTEARNKNFLDGFLKKHGYDTTRLFRNVGWDNALLVPYIYANKILPQFNVYSPNGVLTATFSGIFPMDSLRMALR